MDVFLAILLIFSAFVAICHSTASEQLTITMKDNQQLLQARAKVTAALEDAVKVMDLPQVPQHPVVLPSIPPFLRENSNLFDVVRTVGDSSKELALLATMGDGSRKKLTTEQKSELRNTGRFEVPSERRPGQNHTWLVNSLLVKGVHNIEATKNDGLVNALRVIFVNVVRFIKSPSSFSLYSAMKQLLRWIHEITNKSIGVPTLRPRYLPQEVNTLVDRSRKRFVVDVLAPQYFHDVRSRNLLEAFKILHYSLFIQDLTGRIESDELVELKSVQNSMALRSAEAQKRSSVLVEEVSTDVFNNHRQLVAQVRKEMSSRTRPAAIESEVARREDAIKEERIIAALESDAHMAAISPQMGPLMAALRIQEKIHERNKEMLSAKRTRLIEDKRKELQSTHPLLGRIPEWVETQIQTYLVEAWDDIAETRMAQENEIEELLNMSFELNKPHLRVVGEIARTSARFDVEEGDALHLNLTSQEDPQYKFSIMRHIWSPQNWKRVATQVVVHRKHKTQFVPLTTETYSWDSGSWFWRLRVLPYYWFVRSSNIVYTCLIRNVWRGEWGIQALFRSEPFKPEYTMDKETGEVIVDETKVRRTFLSSLADHWKLIALRRREFENAPDTGLLGKVIARFFHLFFQYIIRGLVGTTVYVLTVPPLMIGNILLSSAIGLTCPLWGLAYLLLESAWSLLISDAVTGVRFPLARLGLMDPAFILFNAMYSSIAVVFSVLLHFPLQLAGTYLQFALRHGWDFMVFRIIQSRVRIPVENSFSAVRVGGPDMSKHYYFQISQEVALFLLSVDLEKRAVRLQMQEEHAAVDQVVTSWISFFAEIAQPFASLDPGTSHRYRDISSEAEERRRLLHRLQQNHLDRIDTVVRDVYDDHYGAFRRLKMTENDLNATLQQGSILAKTFYETRIRPLWSSVNQDPDRASELREQFWTSRDLFEDEFELLVVQVFKEIFDEGFLEPLEQTDVDFIIPIHSEKLKHLIHATVLPASATCGAVAFEAYKPTSSFGTFVPNRQSGS